MHAPHPSARDSGASDAPDVASAAAGDRAAFDRLMQRHHARVYQFLLRRCRCAADAEDACQEAFIRAWHAVPRFDPARGVRFTTWLLAIAARAAASDARSRRRFERPRALKPVHSGEPPDRDGADPWAIADRVLSPRARAALWLRYAEDLTPAQIARVLDQSEVSVRVQLFRARARLAAALSRPAPAASTAPHAMELPHA